MEILRSMRRSLVPGCLFVLFFGIIPKPRMVVRFRESPMCLAPAHFGTPQRLALMYPTEHTPLAATIRNIHGRVVTREAVSLSAKPAVACAI